MKKTFRTLFVTVMLVLALPLNVLAADIMVNVSSTVPEEEISDENIVGKVEVSVEDDSEPSSTNPTDTEPELVLEDISEAGDCGTIGEVAESSEVSIDCTPEDGYQLEDVKVMSTFSPDDVDLKPVEVTIDVQDPNVYTFSMPKFDVYVDVIFSKIIGTSPDPVNPAPVNPAPVNPAPVNSISEPQSATVASEEYNWNATKRTEESYGGTVTVADGISASSLFDLKVHATDERTNINQKFLVQYLVGPTAEVLYTANIYPRRDLTMAEDSTTKTLTFSNLPKYQAGPVYAVIYNEIDGAYVLNGILDNNGTAVFNSTGFYGFKLRNASTITICRIR